MRVLLIKYGKRFKIKQKRYCEYQCEGLFFYYKTPTTTKLKGMFKLLKDQFIYEFIEKPKEFVIYIKIPSENKEFWLYPLNNEEKQNYIEILQNLQRKSLKKLYKPTRKASLDYQTPSLNKKQIQVKMTSNSFLLDSAINPSVSKNPLEFSFNANLRHNLDDFKVLLEEFDDDYEAMKHDFEHDIEYNLDEGRFPSEIQEISGFKSHSHLFQEVLYDQKPLKPNKKKGLLINLDAIMLKNSDIKPEFMNNYSVFQQYQLDKESLSHRFLFPKVEDHLNIDSLKPLAIEHESLLNLAQQFLWEFQLENAYKIYQIHSNHHEFSQGFLEITLMKILISGKKSLIFSLLDTIQLKILSYTSNQMVEIILILSELYLIKGLLYLLLQSKFQAFLALKDSYNCLKKTENYMKKGVSLTAIGFSRFLLISGTYEIGLSLLPSQYRKILELLGISIDRATGLQSLKKCILQGKGRAHYARLLLGLYYIENNDGVDSSFDDAFTLIKESLNLMKKSPLINWLASLFSWRFLQGSESIRLILRSLSNIGGELVKEAYYLKFELGWFEMSRCQWLSALGFFEELAIVCLDFFHFDEKLLMQVLPNAFIIHKTFKTLLNRAKSMENGVLERYPDPDGFQLNKPIDKKLTQNTIVLPHRNTLCLIIAICYINLNEDKLCELWLYMIQYIDKKFSGDSLRTVIDDDVSRLSRKYLKRPYKFFLKYEVLYFLKEISKLKDTNLLQMKDAIEAYFHKTFNIALQNHQSILCTIKLNPLDRIWLVVEYSSGLFLLIIILCVIRRLNDVLVIGKKMKEIKEFLPREYDYLLHHGFHWVGRALLVGDEMNKEIIALDYLKLSKKYDDCEFNFKAKNKRLLKEIKAIMTILKK